MYPSSDSASKYSTIMSHGGVTTWTHISYYQPLMRESATEWLHYMMTSSNRNIFRVTDPLCWKFTDHWRIQLIKACDAELWYFLWSAPERTAEWFETPSRTLWRYCNEWEYSSPDIKRSLPLMNTLMGCFFAVSPYKPSIPIVCDLKGHIANITAL